MSSPDYIYSLTTVVQIKKIINSTAKKLFFNDMNFTRLQITVDERELCFKL